MSKTVIIGGVAGGASCAARLRRLDGDREIIILERGKYISYANCGLPYHVSGVISNRSSLLLMTPELMHDRFRIDVRVENEVTKIDRSDKTVTVKDLSTGRTYTESYNELVIATGSSPLRPRIKGIASDKIRTLWTVPDTDEIRALVQNGKTNTAAVIGGGFIGLEMVENLRHAGLEVSLIEAADQVMALLDFEMAQVLHETIRRNGIALYLSDGVSEFEDMGSSVNVKLQSGKSVTSDLVILAIGVRPNSVLAKDAGLKCNERGGVVVDDHMRTSDKSIYAVGDVIEVEDFISKERTMVPLAGPANKQGRIAADVIAGRDSAYKGTQGSSVAKVFDLTAASTGANEKILNKRGLKKHKDYETLIITQNSHAGYYPGALPLTLKLIFECGTSKILGAQIVGRDGVDKRIDTIGTASNRQIILRKKSRAEAPL
ncbi:MAG: FAD-dependent oxidoreductase [Clostridia bacterium]|nr:FAD-dependent oxidoreductase [Clostridia bacterium]